MHCPNCNQHYDSGKFCPECGTRLVERVIMWCPNCGLEVDSKFCPDCGTKIVQKNAGCATMPQILPPPIPSAPAMSEDKAASQLPMNRIREAANADYPKSSLKALAVAALKIAEVIDEHLPEVEVSYMVHPSEFDSSVNKEALPIHFLVKKNGAPIVAIVAVTINGRYTTHVIETAEACRRNHIGYMRVYADGNFADWIHGEGWDLRPVTKETVEYCKQWLVYRIASYLDDKDQAEYETLASRAKSGKNPLTNMPRKGIIKPYVLEEYRNDGWNF